MHLYINFLFSICFCFFLFTYSYFENVRKMITTLDFNALENYCRKKYFFKKKIIVHKTLSTSINTSYSNYFNRITQNIININRYIVYQHQSHYTKYHQHQSIHRITTSIALHKTSLISINTSYNNINRITQNIINIR